MKNGTVHGRRITREQMRRIVALEEQLGRGLWAALSNFLRRIEEGEPSGAAMTVQEAGRKGGTVVRDTRGHEHYVEIGTKGGHKVRDLIAAGKRALRKEE